jgi:hypothetical protein
MNLDAVCLFVQFAHIEHSTTTGGSSRYLLSDQTNRGVLVPLLQPERLAPEEQAARSAASAVAEQNSGHRLALVPPAAAGTPLP